MCQALTVVFIATSTILAVFVIEKSRLVRLQQKQIATLKGLLKRAKAAAPHLYKDVAA